MSEKKLTKKDITNAWFRWLCLAHTSYSYERYQGLGLCQSIAPAMSKLYSDKEELGKNLSRHTTFFNTEPYTGGMIVGAVLAMEEAKANGEEVPEEAISGLKTGFMGPFAGVGDSLVQGIINPLLLSIGIGMSMDGSVVGVIVYVVAVCALLLSIGYFCFHNGYKLGINAVDKFLAGGLMQKFMNFAAILGSAVLGALCCANVNISTKLVLHLTQTDLEVQTAFFDRMMPGILSVGYVLILYSVFKKGVSVSKVLIVLTVLGAILGLTGIM